MTRARYLPLLALFPLALALSGLAGCGGEDDSDFFFGPDAGAVVPTPGVPDPQPDPDPDPEPPAPGGPVQPGLEVIAQGLTAPVALTHAGDGSGRLFVCDQPGQVRVIDAMGNLLAEPFVDLQGRVVPVNGQYDERGLLGLAFHPDYPNNGRVFVRYSRPRTNGTGEPCDDGVRGCHREVLSEFTASGDPMTSSFVNLGSEDELFTVDQPQFNHNGGAVAFGPDGFLYFSLGDGGGANDGLADMPPSHGATGFAQDVSSPLGSILRIDVDGPPAAGRSYGIPDSNPFAGIRGLAGEIYAFGLRNPYRFSFDDGQGGDDALYAADVGQNLFEELNVIVNGGNYGWVVREGFECFDPFNPGLPPAACATTDARGQAFRDPALVYGHEIGLAIVGGFVYRGTALPQLIGRYIFGDFSRDFGPTGQLYVTSLDGPAAFVLEPLEFAEGVTFDHYLLGLGEDEDGELYLLASDSLGPTGNTGIVYRLSAVQAQ